ncbi:hypothetical protein KR018_011642, partial [Drosophila ironensis]
GTTIIAVEYSNGVVLGADSRTSAGNFVANRMTDKLSQITEKIYCCRSGSAADTQTISDLVALSMSYHEIVMGRDARVAEVAAEFRNYCYNFKDQLIAGMIVAGYDDYAGGQAYSIPLGGMLVRNAVTIGGSGSSYIAGFVEQNYRPNFRRETCVKFVVQAIKLAMTHDCHSGGVVRVAVIDRNGVDRRVYYNTDNQQAECPSDDEL